MTHRLRHPTLCAATLVAAGLLGCADHLPRTELEPPPPCPVPLPFGPIDLSPEARLWAGRCGDVLALGPSSELWRAADGQVLALPAGVDDWTFTQDGHWLVGRQGARVVGLYHIAEAGFDAPEGGSVGVIESALPGEPPVALRGRCDDGQVRVAPLAGGWPSLADPVRVEVERCADLDARLWSNPHLVVGGRNGLIEIQVIDLIGDRVRPAAPFPRPAGHEATQAMVRSQVVGVLSQPRVRDCHEADPPSLLLIDRESAEPILHHAVGRTCDRDEPVASRGQSSVAWVVGVESLWADRRGRSVQVPGALLAVLADDETALLRQGSDLFVQSIAGVRDPLLTEVDAVVASADLESFAITRSVGERVEVWSWRAHPVGLRRMVEGPPGTEVLWISTAGDRVVLFVDGQVRVVGVSEDEVLAAGVTAATVQAIRGRAPVLWLRSPAGDQIAALRPQGVEVLASGTDLRAGTSPGDHAIAATLRDGTGRLRVLGGGW